MYSFVITAIALLFSQDSRAGEFPDGIPSHAIPKIRTGRSLILSNSSEDGIFDAADLTPADIRQQILRRFLDADGFNADRVSDIDIQRRVEMCSAFKEICSQSVRNNLEEIKAKNTDDFKRIKAKLSPTIRRDVPAELILSAGFIASTQTDMEIAGRYIALGYSLKSFNLKTASGNLAATSFINAGVLYAESAKEAIMERRLDFLTSAAQCYSLAFDNETSLRRKRPLEHLALTYFNRARDYLGLLEDQETKTKFLAVINRGKEKLNAQSPNSTNALVALPENSDFPSARKKEQEETAPVKRSSSKEVEVFE
jgi:hypothetical protein